MNSMLEITSKFHEITKSRSVRPVIFGGLLGSDSDELRKGGGGFVYRWAIALSLSPHVLTLYKSD